MERSALAQAARRCAGILLVAAAVASPCAILEKTPWSVPLAVGMNVADPLIALNGLVQGSASDSIRYRRDAAPQIGLEHVTRDGILLVALTAVTVLVEGRWRDQRKRARRKVRAGDRSNPLPPSSAAHSGQTAGSGSALAGEERRAGG